MKTIFTREEWERKGEQFLIAMATSKEENKESGIDKKIITNCKSIKINGIKINVTAFTVSSRYIEFGEVKSADIINGKEKKKIGTRYFIDDDEIVAKIDYSPIKTLEFEQEIGTSGRNQIITIYIQDSYSELKKILKEDF